MIHPKHDYLLFMAILILVLAAAGAVALHIGGVAPTGKEIYHPCQELYIKYLNNHCDWHPENLACVLIVEDMDRWHCFKK